ncbi:MAG: PEGA domain-containing protein [Acidobacteria bacterium]|nr:PEGA domain-containing protein [Acidobacteriota bacterium]
MKPVIAFARALTALPLLAALLTAAEPAARRTDGVQIASGTPLSLRFTSTVSSAQARQGQIVPFEVTRALRVDGVTVIPSGSEGWGVVSAVAPPGRLRRDGSLEIELQGVCLADGSAMGLRAAAQGAAPAPTRDEGEDDRMYVLPALPVMMFLYGDAVTVPAGQEVHAELAESRRLSSMDLHTDEPATGCRPSRSTVQAARAGSRVSVRSDPAGAEIHVDGVYVGDTPSTLNLPTGNHHLEVVKSGHTRWERTIAVTGGGDVNVSASLERELRAGKEDR